MRFLNQFKDIMIILLLISAAISFAFAVIEKNGFSEYLDAIIILFIVLLNAFLGVVHKSSNGHTAGHIIENGKR